MPPLEILLIGNCDRLEFRDARSQLEMYGNVTAAENVRAAIAGVDLASAPPDLIVLAQRFPGEFSWTDLDRLQRSAPLARVLTLLGSWSEGETRTGHPWPAAVRVNWHRWRPHFSAEMIRLAHDECPQWGLPVTSGQDERALAAARETADARHGLIGISACDTPMAGWLADVCAARGWSTVLLTRRRVPTVTGMDAIVWDGTRADGREAEQLAALVRTWTPAPVVALLHNPRIEDRRRALAAGAGEVVSKPAELDDLYWALERVLESSAVSRTQ